MNSYVPPFQQKHDTVTTLILSRLASFLPFFEVIPEIFRNSVYAGISGGYYLRTKFGARYSQAAAFCNDQTGFPGSDTPFWSYPLQL